MATIFRNARFIPDLLGSGLGESNCLAVKGRVIEHIGSEDDAEMVEFSKLADVQQVEVGGKLVIPAFVDAHVHLLQFGISLSKVDLRHCTNLAEIREDIRSAAKQRATKLYLEFKTDPVGGKIHRDENGGPSGLLDEAAVFTLVWPFPGDSLSKGEKLDCLCTAIRVYNESGYTAVIDMPMDETYFALLGELQSAGELAFRVVAHFLIKPSDSSDKIKWQVERVIELQKKFNKSTSPDLGIAGIKIICDGVIDACTAVISRPYLTTKEMTPPIWTPEALQVALGTADAANLQCALHAIGDEAVSMAINGVESLGTAGRRHRIEHLKLTRLEDAKRLGRLGITASIQPVHCDPELKGICPGSIGHDLCSWAFAYSEFHQHGASIAIGTDAPTAPHVPWNNLFNATTRRAFRRPEETDTVNERFKLKRKDALVVTSFGGAYSCFAEDYIGGLEPGKQADFLCCR
ncbi:hypothetical protein ACJZ2D_011150 [Fusarium nematophilum]